MRVVFKENECKCRFKQDVVFNQKTLDFINTIMKQKEVQLISEEGEILASVPVSPSGIGEWCFFGGCLPYVDSKWFCNDIKYLKKLDEMMREDVPLDIVNVIVEEENDFKDDYGLGLVQANLLEDFYLSYPMKKRKSIKRTMRTKAKGVEYKVGITVEETREVMTYWFEHYENHLLEVYMNLFQFWVDEGSMYVNGIYVDGELVGADFVLLAEIKGEKIACGILTPWYKEREELLDKEIGRFVIVKACGWLKQIGYDWFSIGDLSYDYKRYWSHRVLETKVIGLGRWEWREDG